MTAQDLLHYASKETANMDEKEKILQPAQRPYTGNIKCHDIHLVGGQFNTKLAQDSHKEASRAVGPRLLHDTTNNNG